MESGAELQRTFKVLADSTRLRLLSALSEGEFAVQELTKALQLPQPKVSRHLGIMKNAGVVTDRRDGSFVIYRLVDKPPNHWAASWNTAKLALAEDPQVAADRTGLSQVLKDRATPSRSFFDSVGGDWDQLRKVLKDDLLRAKAIEQLVPRNLTVADIGTGTGILAIQLLTLNAKVIAVDRSISMLEAARESLPTNALKRIDLRRGDASQLPIEDNSVDAAFAHMVLHYLARPLDAVREMARITKPGGKVIIVDFISHNEEWMREELHMLWLGFDPKELKQMLKAAGLTDVNCTIQSETSDTPELPRTLIVSGIRNSTNQV